jgi:RNA polymerase sigma factor (sigma-70 family)
LLPRRANIEQPGREFCDCELECVNLGAANSPPEMPRVAMNDWNLVSAFAQGDERAFEDIVTKYFRMVYTTAARQVGDPHLAEEVAQSVFIILSRKAGKLSSGVSVCGWLLQTTRFVSRDAVKMRHRRRQKEQEFASSLDFNSTLATGRNTLEAVLDEALLALPAAEQTGVVAHFYEGKDFKEIGEMLAISEDAAQKRVSRSLVKLRAFLVKRGAKVPVAALAGLLSVQFAHEAASQALSSVIQAAKAAAEGKIGAEKGLVLANRVTRLLRWRAALSLSLKLAFPVVLLIGGAWTWTERSLPPRSNLQLSDPRIEALGKTWSEMVLRIASVKQSLATIPANDPRFQTLLAQVNFFAEDATRVKDGLGVLLTPPHERDQVAEFLAAEVSATLKLNPSEKRAVYSFVRGRLAQGTTLTDGMKAMARDIPAEAGQLKALLSPEQRKSFDSIYGAEGSGFFVYLKIATAGK